MKLLIQQLRFYRVAIIMNDCRKKPSPEGFFIISNIKGFFIISNISKKFWAITNSFSLE